MKKLEFSAAEKAYLRSATERLKRRWLEEKDQLAAALNLKLQQVVERLSRLTDAYLDQAVERDLFDQRKKELLFERRSIEDQIASLENDPEGVPVKLQKFLELAGDAYSLYEMAVPEKKRHLLKIVSSNLVLDQKTLSITYVPPFRDVAMRRIDYGGGPSKGLARTCDALIASLLSKVDDYAPMLASTEDGDLT